MFFFFYLFFFFLGGGGGVEWPKRQMFILCILLFTLVSYDIDVDSEL